MFSCGVWRRGLAIDLEAWKAQGIRSLKWNPFRHNLSSVQFTPGWLFDIGDEILPNYMGIIISQYKNPYKPISIMECHKDFEHCSPVILAV